MTSRIQDDLKDVLDFLKTALPFSVLPDHELLALARQLEIEYLPKRSSQTVDIDEAVYLIRTGAFDIIEEGGQLVDRLAEGECFGVSTVLHDNPNQLQVKTIEDALVYRLPKDNFIRLMNEQKSIRRYFEKLASYRSQRLLTSSETTLPTQHTQPVSSLLQHALVACSPSISIQQAAEQMRSQKVSCLVLMDNDQLVAIVTDRDLRNRVVAEALDVTQPILSIATKTPLTIAADRPVLEAQLQMSDAGVHHLPVVEDGRVVGVVTATDLIRAHSVSIIHFVDRIFREKTIEAIAQLQYQIPSLLENWINADVSPQEIGELFSVIGDAFVRKAIAIALSEMGEAPMKFVWLTFGSQARKEQSFSSDQDNGLILEREPSIEEDDYFQRFSDRVCHLLDQFGYVLCPGDIMASNKKWRKTHQQWLAHFTKWIDVPEPEALLNASIFFDMRVVYGAASWLNNIESDLTKKLKKSDLFFMHMTRNALRTRPPLGFFRSFIVKDSGEHEDELDLKHQGIALINDIARILALSQSRFTANTINRLKLTDTTLLEPSARESLIEAWLLLNELKLETQIAQVQKRQKTTNYINPDDLSPLRRAHLKNAFKAIERAQKSLAHHYLRDVSV